MNTSLKGVRFIEKVFHIARFQFLEPDDPVHFALVSEPLLHSAFLASVIITVADLDEGQGTSFTSQIQSGVTAPASTQPRRFSGWLGIST